MRTFVVEIFISAVGEDGTADNLRSSVKEMLAKAARLPPDRRFDWRGVTLDVQEHEVVTTDSRT